MSRSDQLADLADRLEALGEELADLAIDEIRGAIRSGAAKRPDAEKRITQARRAIDKAVHLLRTEPGALSSGPDAVDAFDD